MIAGDIRKAGHVYVRPAWQAGTVDIWIFDTPRVSASRRVLQLDPTTSRIGPAMAWVEWNPEGPDEPPPSLRVPEHIVGDLAAALAGHLPADQALANHLDDAITTRNRTFALLERLAIAVTTPEGS
jgi:hypothetical protein